MKFDNRIWKTGVVAATITVVAAVFVMRLGEWSTGLNSGFMTSGQTGVTKIVPQIVFGWKSQTVIEIINSSKTTVKVAGNFYNEDGTPSTATYTTNLNGAMGSFTNGSLAGISLPVNAILVVAVTSDSGNIGV